MPNLISGLIEALKFLEKNSTVDANAIEEARLANGKTLQMFLDILDKHLPVLNLEIEGYGDGFSPKGMIYCSWPIVESLTKKKVATIRSSYFSDPANDEVDMSILPVVSARIELYDVEYTGIFINLAHQLCEELKIPIPIVA
jgi:hypothetical protein